MTKTAFSSEFQGEFDVEQLLAHLGYENPNITDLSSLPKEVHDRITQTVVCPSCGVSGAIIVSASCAKKTRKILSQPHFRFFSTDRQSSHDPLCDFYHEHDSAQYCRSVDFRSTKNAATLIVRDLVCKGIEHHIFSQKTIREMRQWFFEKRKSHSFVLDIPSELIEWCSFLLECTHITGVTFQPIFGEIPNFNWEEAAKYHLSQANASQIEILRSGWAGFSKKNHLSRTYQLAKQFQNQLVFNATALSKEYRTTIELTNFFTKALRVRGLKFIYPTIGYLGNMESLVAFCGLLLFINNWNIEKSASLAIKLMLENPAQDQLAGNIIGLDPFYDFHAWSALMLAKKVNDSQYTNAPVLEKLEQAQSELRKMHERWKYNS